MQKEHKADMHPLLILRSIGNQGKRGRPFQEDCTRPYCTNVHKTLAKRGRPHMTMPVEGVSNAVSGYAGGGKATTHYE
jgi:hypothetical protein